MLPLTSILFIVRIYHKALGGWEVGVRRFLSVIFYCPESTPVHTPHRLDTRIVRRVCCALKRVPIGQMVVLYSMSDGGTQGIRLAATVGLA